MWEDRSPSGSIPPAHIFIGGPEQEVTCNQLIGDGALYFVMSKTIRTKISVTCLSVVFNKISVQRYEGQMRHSFATPVTRILEKWLSNTSMF